MLPSSGRGCLECQSRGKRCDGSRPACRRCIRAKIQCTGYPSPGSLGHIVSESRPRQNRNLAPGVPSSVASFLDQVDDPVSSTHGDPAFVRLPEMVSYVGVETSTRFPPLPQTSSDNVGLTVDSGGIPSIFEPDAWPDISFIGPPTAAIEEVDFAPAPLAISTFTRPSHGWPVIGQTLTPPYGPFDLSPPLDPTPASSQSLRPSLMTPGQAGLFDSLLSLARPGEEYHRPSASNTQLSRASNQVVAASSAKDGMRWDAVGGKKWELEDTEGIGDIMVRTLTLDRNVQSNTLPFILECHALWISRMIFQPLRVAAAGREYVLRQYARSDVARRNLILVSNFARAVALSTAFEIDDIPALATFRSCMSRGYMMIASSATNPSRNVDALNASNAINSTYELISISCKLFSLSTVLSTMQTAAPVFRRACPDPPEDLVHLPSLLLHLDVSLRYFATMDILLSVLTDRPMFFRYNTGFTAKITEPMLHIENHLGLQWLYGVPDRLVVTLACINALREDFGICADKKVISELELEIGRFKPIVAASISSDPVLTIARLVVQECWRQAAFIYLYMGLCGADAQDARVLAAHDKFMELFKGAKPGRHPDVFLIFPMIVLGIPTQTQHDRDMIKQRMLKLPDCARPKTLGNQVIHILEDIWVRAALSGRPATWSDLRLACLRVAGI